MAARRGRTARELDQSSWRDERLIGETERTKKREIESEDVLKELGLFVCLLFFVCLGIRFCSISYISICYLIVMSI